MSGAGSFTAAGAMAMGKSEKRRPYPVSDRATEAATVEDIVCHDVGTTFVGGASAVSENLDRAPAAPQITIGGLECAREVLRIADRRGDQARAQAPAQRTKSIEIAGERGGLGDVVVERLRDQLGQADMAQQTDADPAGMAVAA